MVGHHDRNGAGDLRPYLLLQGLALILIPLWQAIHRAPRTDRIAFATAMVLYILAKLAEVLDHEIANALGFVTGHTLKHLIATAATAAVVWGLIRRCFTWTVTLRAGWISDLSAVAQRTKQAQFDRQQFVEKKSPAQGRAFRFIGACPDRGLRHRPVRRHHRAVRR
jgi:hypothetical protein